MAGSASLGVEQAVLQHTLAIAAMPMPTGVFLALCLSAPTPTNATGGQEVTGGGYARQSATFALLTSPANVAANTTTIAYAPALTGWGAVGFFEIWDSLTGGRRLYWGPLVDPQDGVTPITRNVLAGDTVRFTAGVIQVQAV